MMTLKMSDSFFDLVFHFCPLSSLFQPHCPSFCRQAVFYPGPLHTTFLHWLLLCQESTRPVPSFT